MCVCFPRPNDHHTITATTTTCGGRASILTLTSFQHTIQRTLSTSLYRPVLWTSRTLWRRPSITRYTLLPQQITRRTFHTTPYASLDYLLADIGEGITECEIIQWQVDSSMNDDVC
jgi:hypothetical protein